MSKAFVVRMTITLDDVTPAVSRVIEVPLTIRLDRLHTVLQAALGWTDSHLWELTFGRTGFGIPDPSYGFDSPLDARKATLAEALEEMRGKTFRYLYDFGDGWEHSARIEGIVPAAPTPRAMEFRRRVLHPGAAIGEHPIDHDEVYYVLSGKGEVVSDGKHAMLRPGMAAYLYRGAIVGIRQLGEQPLSLIVAYPNRQAVED